MKTLSFASTIFFCFTLSGQVLFDSILESGPNSFQHYMVASEIGSDNTYVIHSDAVDGSYSVFNFDKNLNIIDTLYPEDAGRTNVRFTYPFNFKSGLYYLCVGNDSTSASDFSYHKLENGRFTDSIGFNLDTIPHSSPFLARQIDNNTIQLLVNVTPPVTPRRTYSRIFHLDSNFQVKSYHNPNFDSLIGTNARAILAIHQLNDSTWHLYLSGTLAIYNPIKRKVKEFKKILFSGFDTYSLPNNDHLALGITSYPVKPPLGPSNVPTSLGFYVVNKQADVIDTIQFNAFKDTVPSLWINNYSSEGIVSTVSSSVVYDTNNIFMASNGSYTKFNGTENTQYFYVVKTDSRGTLKWQFIWGGVDNKVTFTGIAPTSDKGCVISGSIMKPNFNRYAMVIKLGPNGNISNVEVDAPENLVSFYPNPVKDKLHFDYLPETHGQYTLEVMDMNGKSVLETPLNKEKGFIPVQLKTGFYIYQLKNEAGKVMQVGKLVAE